MRKTVTGLTAALLASAIAFPAAADVNLFVDVTKFKWIDIDENITIDKDIDLGVTSTSNLASDAEAWVYVNVVNAFNTVGRNQKEDPVFGSANSPITRDAFIGPGLDDASIDNNTGGTQVNQDVGNMANQANVVSFGLTDDAEAATDAEASVEQINGGSPESANNVDWGRDPQGDGQGTIVADTSPDLPNDIVLSAEIEASITDNLGITQVNQNAGNMNNQTNAVAVAAGIGVLDCDTAGCYPVALAESDLGQTTSWNNVVEVNSAKTALINDSVIGNAGITHVNQAVGNMSNQANVVTVSVSLQP